MSIYGWILLAAGAVALGFFPLLALITFVGSRFERMRVSYSWRDLPESAMPTRPKELLQALDAGMRIVRMGQEQSSSVISMYGWLTLSEDGLIAGCFGKGRLGTAWMVMSRLADGTFLETKSGIGTPLVPGRRMVLEEMQTEQFSDMLLVHRSRLDRNIVPARTLTAESLPQQFTDADRAMYEDVIDAGYAVWLDARHTEVKLTLAGSAKSAGRVLTIPFRVSQFKRRAEELKPRWTGFPIEGQAPAEFVVITCRSVGQAGYVYHGEGQDRSLALFTSSARAREYHALYPPEQGDERELQKVDGSWVLQCTKAGHRIAIDPHVSTADHERASSARDAAAAQGSAAICAAAELAGFFAAHAVWCVSEGETLIPLVGMEGADGSRRMIRLAIDRIEEGVALGKERLAKNPEQDARAVLVFDGYITTESGKMDALIVTARDYTLGEVELTLAVPYRVASDSNGFAVHRLVFLGLTGCDPNWQRIGEAFWAGIGKHEKGLGVWNTHLDESR